MKRTLTIIAIGITTLMLAGGIYCARAPITYEMVSIPGYYRWTRCQGELNSQIYSAFERDYRFRRTLIGRPIEAIRPLFPRMTTGTEYPENSYRSKNRIHEWPPGCPVECYWLNGEEDERHGNQFGFYALVRDGKIVDIMYIKG